MAWARGLSNRSTEVKAALLAEGLTSEFMFFERAPDGDYVLLYTSATSLADANSAFERSNLKIDQEAKQIMAETWDFASIKQVERLLEMPDVEG
ncbi:MAG: hypothetical protein C5B49_08845 [Bdellovibrio sp.]|nr:MAG: hypothetical protein C5B49_08845 [Bdellovibrio sp.]